MRKIIYRHLFSLVIVLVLMLFFAGCSSRRPIVRHPPVYPTPTQTQTQVPAPTQIPTPTPPPIIKQWPDDGGYSSLSGNFADSVELQNFIQYMVQKHGFSQTYLNNLFSKAVYLESVALLEEPSPIQYVSYKSSRGGSWSRYRQQFLDDAHINNAVEFWRNNVDALQRASKIYGVDPEYIVAIIGVETYFGRNVGKTRTLDALTTLAFDTERRAKYFTSELEHFLLITREEGYEPRSIVGSWAGAMGLGQFMPSSFRKLAVDFNNDGKRDLWQPEDAIGSVANYFSKHGWEAHGPVAEPTDQADAFSTIELSTYSGSEFWSVHPNFKVIKRYNSSDKYAMAVHQLAQACKQRY